MYAVERDKSIAVNTFAGVFPVTTDTLTAKKKIDKFTPVKLSGEEVEPVSADNEVYGLSAVSVEAGEEVVIYLTGEFFESAINMPNGTTAFGLKSNFRKLGIFLK